jgi:hypothetical protein
MATSKSARATQRLKTSPILEEPFVSEGRAWVWREGVELLPPRYRSMSDERRAALRALFLRKLVPQAEKRGIAAESFDAHTPQDLSSAEVRWARWFREGEDPAPMWALFAQSSLFEPEHDLAQSAVNDTWCLVAWGDGPVLAWASDHTTALRILRAALQAPPPWLHGGMVSRDPAFAVRLERTAIEGRPRKSTAKRRTERTEHAHVHDPAPDERAPKDARAVLAAWRRAHPARSA